MSFTVQGGAHPAPGRNVAASRASAEGQRYAPAELRVTPHPEWLRAMMARLEPEWRTACWPALFAETARGEHPPLRCWRRVLSQFFVIVEAFPKYMALSLVKTTYGKREGDASARRWLLRNLAVEARHAEWYIDWVRALGVDPTALFQQQPLPEVAALHDYLVAVCARGTLAEGVAASNWAIEGITGVWTREVAQPFRAYAADGARIDATSMMWLKAHARYDDAHPDEALELIKLATDDTTDEPARVEVAARTVLRLYATAIAACVSD
ncbi:iron-containing redox enzyme family protein [Myxococcaceae bacterium JPH2]|nr:iron-containing redox enzyme family protein [Myxococcaceae bacterium JPH2]